MQIPWLNFYNEFNHAEKSVFISLWEFHVFLPTKGSFIHVRTVSKKNCINKALLHQTGNYSTGLLILKNSTKGKDGGTIIASKSTCSCTNNYKKNPRKQIFYS